MTPPTTWLRSTPCSKLMSRYVVFRCAGDRARARRPVRSLRRGRGNPWAMTGSNRRHPPCKGGALPTELIARRGLIAPLARAVTWHRRGDARYAAAAAHGGWHDVRTPVRRSPANRGRRVFRAHARFARHCRPSWRGPAPPASSTPSCPACARPPARPRSSSCTPRFRRAASTSRHCKDNHAQRSRLRSRAPERDG